jgi:hypothetical protein
MLSPKAGRKNGQTKNIKISLLIVKSQYGPHIYADLPYSLRIAKSNYLFFFICLSFYASADYFCKSNPCKNGICISGHSDYSCNCSEGFYGKHCDVSKLVHTFTNAVLQLRPYDVYAI